jgi:hypothetical protein
VRLADLGDPFAADCPAVEVMQRRRAHVATALLLVALVGLGTGVVTIGLAVREAMRAGGAVEQVVGGAATAGALAAAVGQILDDAVESAAASGQPVLEPGYRVVAIEPIDGAYATGTGSLRLTVAGTLVESAPAVCADGTAPGGLVYDVSLSSSSIDAMVPWCPSG